MTDGPRGQSPRFLALYALAWAGGAIAYTPLLTLILPLKVITLAGDDAVSWLSAIAFCGAISASLANIGFGWLSDWTGNRRLWIGAGLMASSAALPLLGQAQTLYQIIAVIVFWQVALNMMLSPLAAWAGDHVPDYQKGRLGGLLSLAPAMGAVAGALVTWPGLAEEGMRLWAIAAMVAACVVPVLVLGKPKHFPHLMAMEEQEEPVVTGNQRRAVIKMWLARLLLQISEAALFAFLLIWLKTISTSITDADVARLFGLVLVIAIPVSLIAGRWADRHERPILPLRASAAIAALGLLVMALAQDSMVAVAGYILFGVSGAVFLSLHSAQTLRVLPRPETRGRDLGIFNLTNTVPSLVMPGIALALIPVFGFQGMFFALAGLAFVSALFLAGVRQDLGEA